MAKNGLKYTDGSALATIDEYAEAWSYYLIKASIDLAREKGACPGIDDLKYSLGIMPIDTRKIEVDELITHVERMPWGQLREAAKTYGIRNSTLMALMPSECQHWSNKLNLADGRLLNFHELLDEHNIDWKSIEESSIPQKYAFDKPIEINTQFGIKPAYEYYYNGYQELIEISFEDNESYKFTKNHKLLALRNNREQWIEVGDLVEGDEIISIEKRTKTITNIKHGGYGHTWDISCETEEYILPNGCVSHNTSAQIANATNGIEPPRSYVSIKQSKDGVLKQVVPEFRRLKNKYELLWDQASPEGYLKIVAILQKYIDQSISANTSYNPEHYPDQQLPMSEMLKHMLLAYKWGIKTLYYFNTFDGQGEVQVDTIIKNEAASNNLIIDSNDDEACDACVI